MVTSTAPDGALHARPMTPQQVSDELEAWFFISRSSEQAADITAEPRVNLSFDGSTDWLSVAGHATLVDDRRLVEEMWNPVVESWFPAGPQDPDLALLRVNAESAEYWKAPGGRVSSVLLLREKATAPLKLFSPKGRIRPGGQRLLGGTRGTGRMCRNQGIEHTTAPGERASGLTVRWSAPVADPSTSRCRSTGTARVGRRSPARTPAAAASASAGPSPG